MNQFFKTPKGTELPFLMLQGKQYLQVAHRIVWFREEKPNWGIKVDVEILEKHVIGTATISNENGFVVQVAHKIEPANKAFALEKAETGAIGRALGFMGYGTAYAQELVDEESDGSVVDAPLKNKAPSTKPPQMITSEQAKTILSYALDRGWTKDELQYFLLKEYKFNGSKDIPAAMFNDVMQAIAENSNS